MGAREAYLAERLLVPSDTKRPSPNCFAILASRPAPGLPSLPESPTDTFLALGVGSSIDMKHVAGVFDGRRPLTAQREEFVVREFGVRRKPPDPHLKTPPDGAQ
jgi:hypothetical protein